MAFAEPPFYDDVELPRSVAAGATGGFDFPVKIIGDRDSYVEVANLEGDQPRGELDISYSVQQDVDGVEDTFFVVQGSYARFRVRSPRLYKIGKEDAPQFLYEETGDFETQIQLFKRFTRGSRTFDWIIKKPALDQEAEPLLLLLNGDPFEDFTYSSQTGLITLGGALSMDDVLEVEDGTFDLPGRFDESVKIGTFRKAAANVPGYHRTERILIRIVPIGNPPSS